MLLKIQDLVMTQSRLIRDYLSFRGPCCLIISHDIPEGLGYVDWGYVYIFVTACWLWLSEYVYLTMRYRKLRIWTVEFVTSFVQTKID